MDVLTEEQQNTVAETKFYVVVYQFGKVASTSIVATLNDLPRVTAVQSHFLGEEALASIVPTITGADVSQYFFQHQMGQFIHNMKVTRSINRIRAGRRNERLVVISLARDPMSWIRSSVVQDMAGYLDSLKQYAVRNKIQAKEDGATVTASLSHILGVAAEIMKAEGGVDATIKAMQNRGAAVFAGTPFQNDVSAQRLFRMVLRPFDWFERHYHTALGLNLDQMTRTELGLEHEEAGSNFLVTKYETIDTAIPRYVAQLGLGEGVTLKRENLSDEKLFADEAADAFASAEAKKFKDVIRTSKYSTVFGYQ